MGKIYQWCAKTYRQLTYHAPYHLRIGRQSERIAEKFLRRRGLTTLKRNYRAPCGEIDLIMTENQRLIFVEVRMRIDNSGRESVTLQKQRRIKNTAKYFLTKHPAYYAWQLRFDIIAMSQCSLSAIDWQTNAFEAEYW